jgi:hypothetical protein
MNHGQSNDLRVSLGAVTRARSLVEVARTQGSLRGVVIDEQRRLLAALEGYAVTLASHGHPVPYRMHCELAMYQAMFNPRRPRTW